MQINSTCKIHKAKEEFVCINKKCIETQKSLSCYICLSAKHQKSSHNSPDDFKTIEDLLEQINKEKDKKHILLELAKQWCLAFKKDKRQQIEKCIFYTPDFIQKIINQIDEKINQLYTQLNQISRLLSQISENKIESLQQVLELSSLNCQKLEQLIEKKKQETIIQIQEIESNIDLNIYETFQHYKTKVQNLESKMNKQNPLSWNKVMLSILFLILVINSINQFLPIFSKEQNETISKQFDEISILRLELNLLKEQLQSHIHQTEEAILLLQQNKTDTSNYDNKIKEYFKYKLTDQSEALLKIISDKSQSLNSRVYDIEQLLSLEILPKYKEIQQNQKSIQETFQKTIPQQNSQVSEAQQTLSKQVDYAKAYLLGKIHLNIEISMLKGFQLIFQQTLDKPFRKKEELEILLKVKNDTILCLGSQLVADSEHLQVIACDYPEEIFQETLDWQQARKSQNGKVYWYKLDKHSIGFAPTEKVKLVLCDDYDLEDNRRFSYWYNNGNDGGRRIGNRNDLKNSLEHYMVVYAL